MKKICIALLTAIMSVSLFGMSVQATRNTYKVGVIDDYKFEGNGILGYAETCLSGAFRYADSEEIKSDEYTIDNGVAALDAGDLDFLAMVPFSEKLTPYLDYSSQPIAIGFLALFIPDGSNIYFEDFRSLNNAKIAMLHDSYFEDVLEGYAAENGFSYSPVYFDTAEHMLESASNGSMDAVLMSATTSPQHMRLAAKLGKFDYYIAVKKGNTALLDKLNKLLNSFNMNEPFNLFRNYTDMFGIAYQNMVAFTSNDMYSIRAKDTLRVYVPNNYPMSFYDVSERRYKGIYVNILEQIADNTGLTIQYISDDTNDFNTTVESVIQGKADVILSVSGNTAEVIKATNPYTTVPYLLIADKSVDVDTSEPMTIGIMQTDRWIEEYITKKYPSWTIHTHKSINSTLWAADHGEDDAALISTPDLQTKTSLITHPGLEIKEFSINVPACLGISTVTSPSETVTMLNGIIKYLYVPSEEFEERAYTLSHTYVPNFRDVLYSNRLLWLFIILLIALIIGFLYWRMLHFRMLARLDNLTGIYSSAAFFDDAEKLRQKYPNKVHLLASIDPKNFKLVNDRFGTEVGDQILVSLAKKIKELFHDKGLYCRWQGDIFLAMVEDNDEGRALLSKLEEMELHVRTHANYQIHLKTGVCSMHKYSHDEQLATFIDRANIAKESISNANQNDTVYFTDEDEEKLVLENEIEVDMMRALRNDEFIAYYQPKYDLATNKICGAEALVRWKHKDNGMISPGLFVPVFEHNGFITEVDFNVYEQVLKMIKRRISKNLPVATVSMNVSRCHLSNPDFAPMLDELVEKYGVPKEYIEMEITESIFSEDDSSASDLVYELKRRNFKVSMDDFGSGYSSLNLLRIMPIDTLKIDKVFIEDIETSQRSLTIIQEIITMAKRINVNTVCEGIETEKQRDILMKVGCDVAQGYYYSRPLTEESFESLLDEVN